MSTGGCFLHCKPMSLDYFGNLVGDICSPFLATEHFLFDLKDKKNEVNHHDVIFH